MVRAINSSIDLDFGSLINYASVATFIFLANKPLLPKYVIFSISYYSRLCATVGFFFVRSLTYLIAAKVSLRRIKVRNLKFISFISNLVFSNRNIIFSQKLKKLKRLLSLHLIMKVA
jgi:hypothetical protein